MAVSPGSMYLIDAHALIFQMFHAIRDMMSAPDGRPTNAVFGVTRDLLWLQEEVRPDYLLCAFDMPAPTFRDEIFADYKKHRPPPPDDLQVQVPMIHEVLEAMNLPILGVSGYEADDVMATVAAKGVERGLQVFICTSDKDCRQLIRDNVRLYSLRKREEFDRQKLLEDWGIAPEQVVDYQALVGDSVDNVPGVPGIGAKTAAKLLQEFATLDNLIKRVGEVKPQRIQDSLRAAIESGKLQISRRLVCLDCKVPMKIDWDAWRRREWDSQKLLELFQRFGLRRFADRVRSGLKASGAQKNAAVVAVVAEADEETSGHTGRATNGVAAEVAPPPSKPGGTLFDGVVDSEVGDFVFGANAPAADWKAHYELVDNPKAFKSFLAKLKKQKRFCFDLETTGLDPIASELVGLAFSWQAGEGWYLPVRGPEKDHKLDPEAVLNALRPILEDPHVAKVNQNIKFDQIVLRSHGVDLAGVAGDSMVAHYLLHAGERSHNLDELTRNYFRHENIPITDLIGKGKNQKTMDQVPTAHVCAYAGEDADAAWRLTERLEDELAREGMRQLYDAVEVPLIDVLVELEFTGIRIDVPFLQKLSGEMAQQLQAIEKEIHQAAGREFNIASPKQLREVLFDQLKLPVQKRTGTTNEASTDQESLEKLAALDRPEAAVAVKIVEHRQVAKLKGTYVDALPQLVSTKTGRVHTSFNQTVAATGRLSSSNPNLQNVPTRTEQGRQIRQAFLPHEGWKLLTADYSQIELRLLAHFSGDEALTRAFAEDRDIHTLVAAEIFRREEPEVTAAQRRIAKTVNFGVLYGMSAHGLAERLKIKRPDAEQFISAYFARYPKVLDYQQELLKNCRETGYVGTILGRRRKFDTKAIRPNSGYQGRNQVEREAINMEIQGSAADLIKKAMLNVHHRLKKERRQTKMLLSVHDELVFESPPGEVEAVARLVREEMTGAMQLRVPLKVDIGAGPNWLDVDEVA
jgi:DNA polymerase I